MNRENTAAPSGPGLGLHSLESYEPLIGGGITERILKKAEKLRSAHIIHVSSTFYGGGVTEILTPLTLLMNTMGIETGWRMIQGTPAFFNSTKKFHNVLQGEAIEITEEDKSVYEQVVFENSARLHLDGSDAIIVHDPQPLALIEQYSDRVQPWIWQCHLDMSNPHPSLWDYLSRFVGEYDAAIFSLPEYRQPLGIDQRFITPAINPFSDKNRELTEQEINQSLAYYRIPTDRPIIAQISRFDRWKDPIGVIEAVRKVQQKVDCTLVLLGN